MGSKFKFLKINPKWCLGCKNCELACTSRKAEKSSEYEIKTNIYVTEANNIKSPIHCRHCEDAYCEKICPVNAIKSNDEVVYLDSEKCIGCQMCEQACPYGVISMSKSISDNSNKKIASKCDLCLDRQKNNQSPACYSACPVKAIELI
ncbi:4Fe-4S dicluster domain-containing protein [Thermohalobacter berrensis]|uniref:4Fe-4S ferredoxin n=1 Tax=Thermohalobacter berrensis TaxID=99594 RepID=A0A419T0H6_9FIRM|nr:4Fe-4S dicluster domain-containing protein [Thermohalobacter berrensis]RKD30931.1 4Fe-4S ferredoxin [Thermohalobacter berrensis]